MFSLEHNIYIIAKDEMFCGLAAVIYLCLITLGYKINIFFLLSDMFQQQLLIILER